MSLDNFRDFASKGMEPEGCDLGSIVFVEDLNVSYFHFASQLARVSESKWIVVSLSFSRRLHRYSWFYHTQSFKA